MQTPRKGASLLIPAHATMLLLLPAWPWDNGCGLTIVPRAVERAATVRTENGLGDHRARAHGFVFFLGQHGQVGEPPRLVKLDQSELEFYWEAPHVSKQRVAGGALPKRCPGDRYVEPGA